MTDRLTYIHTYGYGASMTDPVQRAELVKINLIALLQSWLSLVYWYKRWELVDGGHHVSNHIELCNDTMSSWIPIPIPAGWDCLKLDCMFLVCLSVKVLRVIKSSWNFFSCFPVVCVNLIFATFINIGNSVNFVTFCNFCHFCQFDHIDHFCWIGISGQYYQFGHFGDIC